MSQVLALKYRPKSFEELIGQESVSQTLSRALNSQRLSHAYLFSGLRGSGKTSTARIFSKALVCEKGISSAPCDECENCKMANENRHMDIIEMDAASSRKIDDIRELIEHTKYKPNMARFKIFIIDEVHMLTKEAFNALLKTLEEPPEYVKFILATTDPLKLPPTILSRTQHFRFKQISSKDVINHLSHILNLEDIEYELEALAMLSRAGNGSLRDTLTLLDQAILYSKGKITASSIASMLGLLDPKELDKIFDLILQRDREGILKVLKELENYEAQVVIDEIIAYLKEAFFEGDSRFSTLLSERFFRILSESKSLLYLNSDSSFVLTLLFFKMIEAMNIKSVEEMIESLESEKYRDIQPQKVISTPDKIEKEMEKAPKKVDKFAELIIRLKDRNLPTGECFEKSVKFISYEGSDLNLESSASEECKKILRHASSIIKHFVKEIFGIDTVIKMKQRVPKEEENAEPKEENASQNNPNTDSCVASHITEDKKELNIADITEHPMVKKAVELFEANKIEIHPKI